jgi:hypothetical protein
MAPRRACDRCDQEHLERNNPGQPQNRYQHSQWKGSRKIKELQKVGLGIVTGFSAAKEISLHLIVKPKELTTAC